MSSDDDDAIMALLIANDELPRKRRRYWVHPLNQRQPTCGAFPVISRECANDPEKFYTYYRMTTPTFDLLSQLLRQRIFKRDTYFRTAISAEERLLITLR